MTTAQPVTIVTGGPGHTATEQLVWDAVEVLGADLIDLQVGILGLHKTQDRPVAIAGKVEIRPMMYVALSYDHRIIDGQQAVLFLVKVNRSAVTRT